MLPRSRGKSRHHRIASPLPCSHQPPLHDSETSILGRMGVCDFFGNAYWTTYPVTCLTLSVSCETIISKSPNCTQLLHAKNCDIFDILVMNEEIILSEAATRWKNSLPKCGQGRRVKRMRLGIVACATEKLTSSEKGRRRRRGGPSSFLSAMRAFMAIDYDPLTLPRVKSPHRDHVGR